MKIIFKKFKNKINNVESFNAFFYLGIFINLFPILPSGNFFNNWLLLMIHLPLAFYIASNKENLGYFQKSRLTNLKLNVYKNDFFSYSNKK